MADGGGSSQQCQVLLLEPATKARRKLHFIRKHASLPQSSTFTSCCCCHLLPACLYSQKNLCRISTHCFPFSHVSGVFILSELISSQGSYFCSRLEKTMMALIYNNLGPALGGDAWVHNALCTPESQRLPLSPRWTLNPSPPPEQSLEVSKGCGGQYATTKTKPGRERPPPTPRFLLSPAP